MIECFPKRNCAGRFLNYRSPLICSPVERSSVPGALWDLADKTWVGDVAVTPRYRAVRKRYIRTRRRAKWSNWAATASQVGNGASSGDVKGEPGWMLSLISCVCFLFSCILYQLRSEKLSCKLFGHCCVREWDRAISCLIDLAAIGARAWPFRRDSARTHVILVRIIACRKETMKPLIIHTIIDTGYRATFLPGLLCSLYLTGV